MSADKFNEVQQQAEEAVFIKNYDYLWNGLTSPNEVAAKLFSNRLISAVQLDDIQSATGKYRKNTIIMNALCSGPPGTLLKFCAILKDIPHLEYVAKRLGKDLQFEAKKILDAASQHKLAPHESKRLLPTHKEDKSLQQSKSPEALLGEEFAPLFGKLIKLVENPESDISEFQQGIEDLLEVHGFRISLEVIRAEEGKDGQTLQTVQLTCTTKEAYIQITVSQTVQRFALTMVKIIDTLESNKGVLWRMQGCLAQMSSFTPNLGRIFSPALESAKTVREFFHLLRHYYSCIDTDLLKVILEASGCQSALEALNEFLGSCDRNIPLCKLEEEMQKSYCNIDSLDDSVAIKARVKRESLTEGEYEERKSAVSGTLRVPSAFLRHSHTEVGSFVIVWRMSIQLVDYAKSAHITKASLHFLAQLDITEIAIDNFVIVPPQGVSEPLSKVSQAGNLEKVMQLVNSGVSVESADEESGQRPLMIASKHGHSSVVEFLLSKEANPNAVDKNGNTALDKAVQYEHWEVVELLVAVGAMSGEGLLEMFFESCRDDELERVQKLLQDGISVDVPDENGSTALQNACKKGQTQLLKILQNAGANMSVLDKCAREPLMLACKHGHAETAQYLLSQGANPNVCSKDQKTPLDVVIENEHWEVVEVLVAVGGVTAESLIEMFFEACRSGDLEQVTAIMKSGVKLDVKDKSGRTPVQVAQEAGQGKVVALMMAAIGVDPQFQLQHASMNGLDKFVVHLVESGVNIDCQDQQGMTPLMMAASAGHTEVVKVLIHAGANVDARGQHDVTALMIASSFGHSEVVQQLIDAGANVNARDEGYSAALITSSRKGYIDIVRMLIKAGADVNVQNKYGGTPVLVATQSGHTEIVEVLIAANADVNATSEYKQNALTMACTSGHTEIAKKLIRGGANVNTRVQLGQTALMNASMFGHEEIVQELLQAGADVNAENEDKVTALMEASGYGHLNIVRMLIGPRANVNAHVENGSNSIMWASKLGHVEVVQELILAGANVNAQTKDGTTALLLAASEAKGAKVARILIKNGAHLNQQEIEGFTPLMIASGLGHTEIVQELIAGGANLDMCNERGSTALMFAAREGYTEIIQLLMDSGADVNLFKKDGFDALTFATRGGNCDAMRLLLSKANVNQQGSDGVTACMIATASDDTEAVRVLLQAGAQPDLQEHHTGWTALCVAAKRGHIDIVRLLLQHGASLTHKVQDGFTALDIGKAYGHKAVCEEMEKYIHGDQHPQLNEDEIQQILAAGIAFTTFLTTLNAALQQRADQVKTVTEQISKAWIHPMEQLHRSTQTPPFEVAAY